MPKAEHARVRTEDGERRRKMGEEINKDSKAKKQKKKTNKLNFYLILLKS